MKIEVKVLKLDGRTGLRKPGLTYLEHETKVQFLLSLGLVEVIEQVEKESKVKVETKELKTKRQTKAKK